MDLFDKDGLDTNFSLEYMPTPEYDSVRNVNFMDDQDKDIILGYEFNMTYPHKSTSLGMTRNGRCEFWINCDNKTNLAFDGNNVWSSRHRVCCAEEWIGTTLEGIWNPCNNGDDAGWIGGPGIQHGILALVAFSVLVAMWNSLTNWLSETCPMVQFAWTSGLGCITTYPATTFTICSVIFLVFCAWMMHERKVNLQSRSHLGPGQVRRRWRGNLQQKWSSKVKLKGFIFLMLYVEAAGKDAQQANDLLTKIMERSNAATQLATTATSMIEGFQSGGKGSSRLGDGAKALRAPDVFEMDDPVRYSLWREQFLNWLVFCDSKYGELIKDVDNMEFAEDLGSLAPDVKELSAKLLQHFVFIPTWTCSSSGAFTQW